MFTKYSVNYLVPSEDMLVARIAGVEAGQDVHISVLLNKSSFSTKWRFRDIRFQDSLDKTESLYTFRKTSAKLN
jgi:hypothetical protein